MTNETATVDPTMQDITARLESTMFGSDEVTEEPEVTEEDEVVEDEVDSTQDDDTDSDEDDEGSDLEDEVEELTLADYLGVDEDRVVEGEDGSYLFNAIIDGETKQVPLKDLVAGYQLQSHVNNKSIALENERKEFEDVRNNVATELKSRVEGIEALGNLLEEQIVGEFNRINWDELRVQDPSQWAALRQEFAERAQRVQQTKDLVGQEKERLEQEQQEEFQTKFNDYIKEQTGKLIAANPEWADDTKRQEGLAEIRGFLNRTYGFSEEEMKTVGDHRLIKVFQDAKAYREGKKAAETKREKKLPKFQKPGAARNAKSLSKARAVKAKKDAVRKSGGHVRDVANLLEDRM